VVASTLGSLESGLSAAIGALSGPLHGTADEAAFRASQMLVEADRPAVDWIEEELAAGRRVMGIGHRVYKTVDPRARVLRAAADALTQDMGGNRRALFEKLVEIDDAFAERGAKGRPLHANVEFYKGVVFHALGIPPELFTCMFAMARAAGWGAHMLELWAAPHLYRPRLRYQGPAPRSLS
jgi:citrate synthase